MRGQSSPCHPMYSTSSHFILIFQNFRYPDKEFSQRRIGKANICQTVLNGYRNVACLLMFGRKGMLMEKEVAYMTSPV
jgi:hypothetical protein